MALLSSLDSHENTPRHSAAPLDWQDFSRMYHLHLVIAGLSIRIRVRLGEERWLPLCIQALLLTPLQLLDALRRRRQLLGHGAADPLDRTAHLLANAVMSLVSNRLADDALLLQPAQFVVGLGDFEQVRRELRAGHVVENAAFLDAFAGGNVACRLARIE